MVVTRQEKMALVQQFQMRHFKHPGQATTKNPLEILVQVVQVLPSSTDVLSCAHSKSEHAITIFAIAESISIRETLTIDRFRDTQWPPSWCIFV